MPENIKHIEIWNARNATRVAIVSTFRRAWRKIDQLDLKYGASVHTSRIIYKDGNRSNV